MVRAQVEGGRRIALALLLATAACGGDEAPATRREAARLSARAEARPEAQAGSEQVMIGAFAHGSHDTSALARLAASLQLPDGRGPRPGPPSPLTAVFAGVVEQLFGDPGERLEAVGLRADARIRYALRPLDHRGAAVRKRLGELVEAGDAAKPEDLAQLRSWAGTLGVHLRLRLPVSDRDRLLTILEQVVRVHESTSDDTLRASICPALEATALCTGRDRLLLWIPEPSRDGDDDGDDGKQLQVDVAYLFYGEASRDDLLETLRVARDWPEQTVAAPVGWPPRGPGSEQERALPDIALRLRSAPTLTLLQTEAVADAAVARVEDRLDYHDFLDRERALQELHPDARLFDGLAMALDVDGDELRAELRWQPAARVEPELLAAALTPIPPSAWVPSLEQLCADMAACGRFAGLSLTTRFAPLAAGGFVDYTTASRVLRQAGDRGPILLMLASWPNLMGTAGAMTSPAGDGLLETTMAALVSDNHGLGFAMLEVGEPEKTEKTEKPSWLAYLRLGPVALAAAAPLASLARLSLRPITLTGVDGLIERGSYEGDPIYLVDQRGVDGGFGGWILAGDDDERVRWILGLPPPPVDLHRPQEVVALRVHALGAIAAREQLAYVDDPALRAWLDRRWLSVDFGFDGGAYLRLALLRRDPP